MTVTIPTSEAQYGYVVGRVIRALGDSADPDDKPDAVAATGKVTFTPKATLGRTTDYSAFIVREKLDAPLDAQGNLVRYEGATPAGISLTVGAYKVEFALASGSIPSFEIEVTAAHTQAAPLDLVTAAPYVPPSGVTVQTMLVPADAVIGQVLAWSASGLDWVDMAAAAGGVSSVAGRTGAVVLSSADLTDVASLATDAELSAGLSGKANSSHAHGVTDLTATGTRDATTYLRGDNTWATPAGGGGGVTDHGALSGLADDDHSLYALADGTRGAFAAPLGADDNYVTDAEKVKLSNLSGTNTGDQDLSGYATTASLATVATTGAYADLTGAPTIPDSPDDIGAAPATHEHTAADIDSGAALDGHVMTADGAGGAAWEPPPGGGGGITLAPSIPPEVGEYFPVLTYNGAHQNFQLISGKLIPCPVLVETAGNTDAVALRVETGAAGVTVELALYSWGRTASHVATLGTVDVSSSGLKTLTFTPRALAAGRHVVVARPIGGNVTVWGFTGGAMVVQRGPDGGNNAYAFPHAAAGSMPASITWDYTAGLYGNAVPKLMLRRSL